MCQWAENCSDSYDFQNISGDCPEEDWSGVYIGICVPVITFCLLSVAVNLVILSSYFWMQRASVSRTLQITLSLVVSDLCTFVFDSLSLTFNSLLPVGFGVTDPLSDCTRLLLEALRIGGKLTTLGHLLALAINHYLGIRKPLHYPSLMTCRNVSCVALLLWIVPTMSLIIYFNMLEDDGFSVPGCDAKFMMTYDFRSKLTFVFFGTILLMSAIYLDIYLIVRRHQANRSKFRRAGTYRANQQTGGGEERRNEKALYTTLLIVGSTVIGWLPASLSFFLVCEDCAFTEYKSGTQKIAVNALANILLILKTSFNSYIYAARMNGIKTATRRMWISLKRSCCRRGKDELGSFSESRQMHSRTSTRRSQKTVHCRIQSLPRHSPSSSTQL